MKPKEKMYTGQHQRRQRRYTVLSCLAAVVVFCTTYALILPAITMSWACGQEAHSHSEDCYDAQGALICGLEEHSHTEACRMASRELSYEDGELCITVTVESEEPLPEELSLTVATPESAQLLSGDQEQQGLWLLRQLTLLSGSEALDSGSYRMTARVQVKPDALGQELAAGAALRLYQLNGQELCCLTEQLTAGGETAEPLSCRVQDGLLALQVETTGDPAYTVQYYAQLPCPVESGDTALRLNDHSGQEPHQAQLWLRQLEQTDGEQPIYQLDTELQLTQICRDSQFTYIEASKAADIDRLSDGGAYTLEEIWVLKDGRDAASTQRDDWQVYAPTAAFRTDQSADGPWIREGSVLRLVYGVCTDRLELEATLYDTTAEQPERLPQDVERFFNEENENVCAYPDSSLSFVREGDSYTLSAVTLNKDGRQLGRLTDLTCFTALPVPQQEQQEAQEQPMRFTNGFWPLDRAVGQTDEPTIGADGSAHNSCFGMCYALDFTLTEDYVGALEYSFIGNDALWLFLDDELICTLDGQQETAGVQVDLRDFLPQQRTEDEHHTLTVYYLQSSSTDALCYMHFTLPNAAQPQPEESGDIPDVEAGFQQATVDAEPQDSAAEHQLTLKLLVQGVTLERGFDLQVSYTQNGETVTKPYTLADGQEEQLTVPSGTEITIQEPEHEGFALSFSTNGEAMIAGPAGYTLTLTQDTTVTAVNTAGYALPETGGTGTYLYTLGGGLLLIAAGALLLYKQRRKGGAEPS